MVVMAGPISRILKENKIEKCSEIVKGIGGKTHYSVTRKRVSGRIAQCAEPKPLSQAFSNSPITIHPGSHPRPTAHPHHRTEFGTQTTLQKDWPGHAGRNGGMGNERAALGR